MQEVYQAGLEQEEIDRAVQERERACSWLLMILNLIFVLHDDLVNAKQDDICHFIWLILPRCKLGMLLSGKVFIRVLVELFLHPSSTRNLKKNGKISITRI
jgi:hypothetical protein